MTAIPHAHAAVAFLPPPEPVRVEGGGGWPDVYVPGEPLAELALVMDQNLRLSAQALDGPGPDGGRGGFDEALDARAFNGQRGAGRNASVRTGGPSDLVGRREWPETPPREPGRFLMHFRSLWRTLVPLLARRGARRADPFDGALTADERRLLQFLSQDDAFEPSGADALDDLAAAGRRSHVP